MTMFSAPSRTACRVSVFFAAVFVQSEIVLGHQPHDPVLTVAVSPNYAQDHTMFVATDRMGFWIGEDGEAGCSTVPGSSELLLSTDGGQSFSHPPGFPVPKIYTIAVSPGYAQDGTVFVAGNGGLIRTADRGGSWASIGPSDFSTGLIDVALSPGFATDGTLFAVRQDSTLYKSTARGNTWKGIAAPAGLVKLAISPQFQTDKMLLAGTRNGIYRSADAGATWKLVTTGITLSQVTTFAFSPAYKSDRTAFAAADGSGVLMTGNGGTTWTLVANGLTDLRATSLAVSPYFARDSTLWVSTAAGGVFASANRGATWTPVAPVPRPIDNSPATDTHYRALAAGPTSGGGTALFLGMWEGLWSSTDRTASWQYCDTVPTGMVRGMAISPNYSNDQTLAALTYGGGALWTTTGTKAWAFRNTGMTSAYADSVAFSPTYAADALVLAGTSNGLQRMAGGSTFWQTAPILGEETHVTTIAFSPSFAQDRTVWIGTHNGCRYPPTVIYEGKEYPNQGLFVSTDGGNTWAPTSVSGPPVDEIAVSPAFSADRTLFVSSSSAGLLKSTDGGQSWTSLGAGVSRVVFSPAYATDRTVFAASGPFGIYRSTDGGATWSLLAGTETYGGAEIALSPNYAADQTLFIGSQRNGLVKSVNGGNTLMPLNLPDTYITALVVSPGFAQDRTVIAAADGGIYKSTDAGSTWSYTAPPARVEEDRTVEISYQGSWVSAKSAYASTGRLVTTSQFGATATLRFHGSGARWIGPNGPQFGSATILLDGVADSTVVLTRSQAGMQQVLWQKRGLACGTHTVTINASAASGQLVGLDAFDTWQDTCPH